MTAHPLATLTGALIFDHWVDMLYQWAVRFKGAK